MSRRLDVVKGVVAMAQAALPGQAVKGLDNDAAFPKAIPPNGYVAIREGDPGEPDVDLSPLSYNYQHRIPAEMAPFQSSQLTEAEALDSMMSALGLAIAADRTLGGLCDWLEAEAPSPDFLVVDGAKPVKTVILTIVAHYATPDPLN